MPFFVKGAEILVIHVHVKSKQLDLRDFLKFPDEEKSDGNLSFLIEVKGGQKTKKMVMQKTESGTFDAFTGKVMAIDFEPSKEKINNDRTITTFGSQYKISMETKDTEKGIMYEWIPLSPKSEDGKIRIEGSVMDKFLEEIERLHPEEAKNVTTMEQTLNLLAGRSYKFGKKKFGRSYNGREAKEYWYPTISCLIVVLNRNIYKPFLILFF